MPTFNVLLEIYGAKKQFIKKRQISQIFNREEIFNICALNILCDFFLI